MMDKRVCISSSISNFRDKILKRYELPEWHYWRDRYKPTLFFGCYHIMDYVRILWHQGERTIFWCGGDILNLRRNSFSYGGIWRGLIARASIRHICENEAEQLVLGGMGIRAIIQPIIIDDPAQFNVTYKQSNTPHVFICTHPGEDQAYGIFTIEGIASTLEEITFHVYGRSKPAHEVWFDYRTGLIHNARYVDCPNVIYHGQVSNEQFNREIRKYQAALRLNDWDGFGEVLAKSVLLGQHPISRLPYPHITHVKDITDLINALRDLKNKKEPNLKGRAYWLNEFNKKLI